MNVRNTINGNIHLVLIKETVSEKKLVCYNDNSKKNNLFTIKCSRNISNHEYYIEGFSNFLIHLYNFKNKIYKLKHNNNYMDLNMQQQFLLFVLKIQKIFYNEIVKLQET